MTVSDPATKTMINRVDGECVNRRSFLAGLAATAALPALTLPAGARAVPSDPDVVIIGAGAAGLAAARQLAKTGTSFVILEAKSRIGGRAHTDTTTFGVPFDQGASWIYQADHNPLTPYAHRAGYTLVPHDDAAERLYVDGVPANYIERYYYDDAWYEVETTMRAIAHSGQDVSANGRLPVNLPWTKVVENWIGPLDMGMDLESFSALDWWELDYKTPSLLVREGFGRVVADLGTEIPVQTNTPVTCIRWGGADGVEVDTPRGTIRAKRCIVTVSTGVLASESIRFDPVLPVHTQRALDSLPMGLLAKIALQFKDCSCFGVHTDEWLSYTTESRELSYFLSRPFERNLLIGFVGGKFAWDLTAAGQDAAIDFALGELRRLFGPDVDRQFVRGTVTGWGQDGDVRGAFAIARPGGYEARKLLAQSLEGRVHFAGEALGGGLATTVGGAFSSGRQVAAEVARKLS